MDQKLSKNFFLISFLPAFAYWYLEANYPLQIALAGGMILAILEVTLEKYFTKHVHTLSKFNFFLIVFLGLISLLGDEGIWFKLQPFFTGLWMSGFMGYRLWRGEGMLLEMMKSMPQGKKQLPDFIMKNMEKHVCLFFFIYALFMAFVAIAKTTDTWLFFKTIGLYIVFGIFMFFEFFFIRYQIKKMVEHQKKADILKKF
jgi:intracellular septation protein